MNEQFSIAGKVAVITGAGGVLGGSIAKCFMEQGAKVVAVDIRQEQLDKRVEELKAYGEDVIGIVGNVLDIASLEKLADDIVAKWGRIDILLNIAGGRMPVSWLPTRTCCSTRTYLLGTSCRYQKVSKQVLLLIRIHA